MILSEAIYVREMEEPPVTKQPVMNLNYKVREVMY